MDFDTGILSLIEGYVSEAMNTTGTKRALHAPKHETTGEFEGDTIPDMTPMVARSVSTFEDFDELTTAVVVQQRLIR